MELLALLTFLYFLPAFVAVLHNHPYAGSILVINVFLGWTLIGWTVALAWSVFPIQRPARQPRIASRPSAVTPSLWPKDHVTSTDRLFKIRNPSAVSRWDELDREENLRARRTERRLQEVK
jgi:Superinfection immunity protein